MYISYLATFIVMNKESVYLLESSKTQNKSYSFTLNKGDDRTNTQNTDNRINQTNNRTQRRRNPVAYVCILYTALITDWPSDIATYISGFLENTVQQEFLSCLQCFCSLAQFLIATFGLFCQSISCFHRDRLDKNVIRILEDNNASKLVECHEASQLFSAILVPDMIIFYCCFGFY